MHLGVDGDGRIEVLQGLVAELLRHGEHARFNLRHLRQAKLVNLLRRKIGSGRLLHVEGIPRFAVRQSPLAGFGAAFRSIFVSYKPRQPGIGREDRVSNHAQALLAQTLLVGLRDACREFIERLRQRRFFGGLCGNRVGLIRHFSQQETGRH